MKMGIAWNKLARLPLIVLAVFILEAGDCRCGEILQVAAVGDIMTGNTFPEPFLPPDDGRGLFDAVKGAWSDSDIVFGNLEGPMIDGGISAKCEGRTNCYAFRMPTRYAAHLAGAGFTALGIINNHSYDFGPEGMASTLASLRAAGISPVGGRDTATRIVKGKRIALVGFAYPTPSTMESRYFHSVTDIPKAKKVVSGLARENDIVIVSFHGGAEGRSARRVPKKPEIFLEEERGDVHAFAHAVIDAGADLVVGHGPHVLRAVELYKDRLIAYSLGNFLTYGWFNIKGVNGITVVLKAGLDPKTGAFVSGQLVSVKQVDRGLARMDPENAGAAIIRELSASDFPGSGLVIQPDGTITTKK
ncbi:MAG: CapA family protein [Deltaproteobacteria bacterium]|nr:CapA family protein [Deltaproteobacteria bacterium]